MDDAEGSKEAGAKLLAACKDGIDLTGTPYEGKECNCDACKLAKEVIANADLLTKKSIWIFGGDGWGIRHRLRRTGSRAGAGRGCKRAGS